MLSRSRSATHVSTADVAHATTVGSNLSFSLDDKSSTSIKHATTASLPKAPSPEEDFRLSSVRINWQLKAMFGWEASKQAELYTRKANRMRMEAEAANLLLRAGDQERAANNFLPLLGTDESGGRRSG